jgi:toxin-antitoxin system PIN domain toxin
VLFLPDLNVWIALSSTTHRHHTDAWQWFNQLPANARMFFCRPTQLGLLRLLTNRHVMGEDTLTLRKAWDVYDQWITDPRVDSYPEPRGLDPVFRELTAPFAAKPATNAVVDCYLLAYAKQTAATLVTFDRDLHQLALAHDCASVIPAAEI